MKILEQVMFEQPSGDRVILRRLETPFYPPYSFERLVDGKDKPTVVEGAYGIRSEWAGRYFRENIEFEERIKSKKL